MNILNGEIASIQTNGSLSHVKVKIESIVFDTIIIETPETASYLKIGNHIKLIFKETEVIIGKNKTYSLSIHNKIQGEILEIKNGALLSKLIIKTTIGTIVAVIISDALKKLQLQIGEKIIAMVKTTEIMITT